MRRALSATLLLICISAGAAPAQESVTVDAGYALLQNKVLVAAAYGTPAGWTVGALVRVMYSPSVNVAGQTGIQGYAMTSALDVSFLVTAGFSFAILPGVSVSPSAYAGAWLFSSDESLTAPSFGIDARDGRTLSAFRAGLRVDARWIVLRDAGLGVVLGADVPWQLFKLTALGLAEASSLLDISAGVTWRLPADR